MIKKWHLILLIIAAPFAFYFASYLIDSLEFGAVCATSCAILIVISALALFHESILDSLNNDLDSKRGG